MLESPPRILARFPRPVRLLVLGTLVNRVGALIIPFLTLVPLRDFGLSEGQTARLLLAFGVGTLTSPVAGGVLTDRLGRRRTLLTSLLGSGVLATAMGLAPSTSVFVPLLLAFASVAELYRPAPRPSSVTCFRRHGERAASPGFAWPRTLAGRWG